MSDELNLDKTELRRRRGQDEGHSESKQNGQNGGGRTHQKNSGARWASAGAPYPYPPGGVSESPAAPVNLWQVLEVLLRRWTWLFAVGAFCGLSVIYHLIIVGVGLFASLRYDRALVPAPEKFARTGESYG